MGMFDDLPDIKPAPKNNTARRGMFDDLPDIEGATSLPVAQMWPPDMSSDVAQTPQGKRLETELRAVADKELLNMAGPVAQSPLYAGFSEFANTAGLNIPRNAAAALRTLKTGRTFGQEYDFMRDVDAAAARQSRKAAIAGDIAGVIGQTAALAPLMPATAATLPGRIAQGAGIGAGVGSASEAIDSKDRGKAAQAGMYGAAGGALGVPVGEGIGALVAAAGGRQLANTVRGLINPESEAARRVAAAVRADRDTGAGGLLSRQEAMDAAGRGQEIIVADAGGQLTRGMARSAANTSPEARAALGDVIERRFSTQGDRTADFVRSFGSGQSAVTTSDQLAEAARRANRPAYARAYNDPNAQAIWNEDIAGLMQAPAIQEAIRSTMKTGANKAAAQGFKAPKNPFVEDANGNITLRTNPDGSQAIPSIQFWDYVQRNLNDAIGKAQRSGAKSEAGDLTSLRSQLNSILDNTVPAFKDARAGAARFFGAEDALQAGQSFVSSTLDNAEAAKALSKMSKAERGLFAEGFVSELVNKIRNISDRQTVINKIYNTPNAKQRVEMALGKDRAKELEAFLHVESVADMLRNEVKGNSTTVRQLIEMGLAGGGKGAALGAGAGYLAGNGDPSLSSVGSVVGMLLQRKGARIDDKVARKVGELLASNDPQDFRKIVRMAANSPSLLSKFRTINMRAIGSTSGAISQNNN